MFFKSRLQRMHNLKRDDMSAVPGRYSWTGGLGPTWANDSAEKICGILMTQRNMTLPLPLPVFSDFWTSAYQAISD